VATFFTTLLASKAGPPPPDPTGGKLAPETPIPIEGASACAHLAVDEGCTQEELAKFSQVV
jgi:hypothetical protein